MVQGYGKALQKEISAAALGVNGVAGSATTTSNWVKTEGFNQATILIKFVASGDATSVAMTFNIEISNDGGTTAYLLQTSAVSSGVATLSTKQYSKATSNDDINFVVDFPLNYEMFRIKSIAVATGHANDTITASVNLGKI
jgi:hypothetical protein